MALKYVSETCDGVWVIIKCTDSGKNIPRWLSNISDEIRSSKSARGVNFCLSFIV